MVGLPTLLVALAGVQPAQASPFHGCTFLSPRLSTWSVGANGIGGCANFKSDFGACTKTRTIGPVTVTYPATVVSGRLPAYFIEVTPHFGQSVFAVDPDGVLLKLSLDAAANYYTAQTNPLGLDVGLGPLGKNGTARVAAPDNPQGNQQFWHARVIKVPYAAEAWSFPSIGVASGSAFPTCFDGVSEFTPGVWADLPGHGETLLTAVTAPIAHAVCHQPGVGLLPDVDLSGLSPWDNTPSLPRNTCVFPTTAAAVNLAVLEPTSEAMEWLTNPLALSPALCMGRLGPLLPRTGHTHSSNLWEAAETVAYRMASLAEDHWLSGPGIEPGDRWQIVWPPAATPSLARCHQPGAILAEMSVPNPAQFIPALPGTDGPVRPSGALGAYVEGMSPVIIAVWRRFERCVEPFQGPLFLLDTTAGLSARQAVCQPINALSGVP